MQFKYIDKKNAINSGKEDRSNRELSRIRSLLLGVQKIARKNKLARYEIFWDKRLKLPDHSVLGSDLQVLFKSVR